MSAGARQLDLSFVERLAQLRFAVGGIVDGIHSGLHKSRRRGGGLVFAEHRAYRPGDDPRTIDWRAFARSDHHRVKRFEHEAQLRALLALDVSGSMMFGGPELMQSKVGYAAALLGACAELLLGQGDAAGAVLFDEAVCHRVPVGAGRLHAKVILEALCQRTSGSQGTSLAACLGELERKLGRNGALFLASDLLDFEDGALAALARLTARGHRVFVLHVLHKDELELPFEEPLRILGSEGEAPLDIDPRSVRASYKAELARFTRAVESACSGANARYVQASTHRPPQQVLREALWGRREAAWA